MASTVSAWSPLGPTHARTDGNGVVVARVWERGDGWSWATGRAAERQEAMGWSPTRSQAQALADWVLYETGRLADAPRTV